MRLPVSPPLLPMLAKRVEEMPAGPGWIFEPKWDGFRALVFRDGDDILVQSRDEKPLEPLLPGAPRSARRRSSRRDACSTARWSSPATGGLDFEALQLRLHPAASRVKMLAEERPASVVFWDLLCEGERDLRATPFRERRAALEACSPARRRRSI